MPPREANILPWEAVALDLFGPWTVKVAVEAYEFYAFLMLFAFVTGQQVT
jgi:hypothetical protein